MSSKKPVSAFPLMQKLAWSVLLVWPVMAQAAGAAGKADLQQAIAQLVQKNQQQEARILALEQRVAALASSGSAAVAARSDVAVAAPVAAVSPVASTQPVVSGQAPLPVVNEVPKSIEDIYQEASGFAAGKFSIEPGFTYTHYDTRELMLNGFLALDSIFLGTINLDRIRSDTMTLDLTARYSPSPRWQLDVNVPLVARDSTYFSGGSGGSSTTLSQVSVSQGPKLGDVSFGVGYKLVEEDADKPDIVWSVRTRAPTGKHPYGIKLRQSADNNNLSTPDELPTGNGVWGVTTGLSFVKTVDPAVLFANIGYTHNLSKSFTDISATAGVTQAGEISLGNSWTWGAGFAFALNDKLSLGTSYSQQITRSSRVRQSGGQWANVIGSEANAANLNLGLTYAPSKSLSIIPNLSIGLTPDTPNYAFSVKFPYRF